MTFADFSKGSIVIVQSGKPWSYSETSHIQDQMHSKVNSRLIRNATDKHTPHKRQEIYLLLLLQLCV